MHDLGQTAEALPLVNESNIYGGVGSDEVNEGYGREEGNDLHGRAQLYRLPTEMIKKILRDFGYLQPQHNTMRLSDDTIALC